MLSASNVMELSAPLASSNSETNVMRLLNRVEAIPHTFIAEARIPFSEIKEAVRAYQELREYSDINPFEKRFDYVASQFSKPPTRQYLNFGLAEAVFTLWTEDPNLFSGFQKETLQLRRLLSTDRSARDNPSVQKNFANVLRRYLTRARVNLPHSQVEQLADWIYSSGKRCPSFRLGYEVFHKLLKNKYDEAEKGDIYDFAHIDCLPYVDAITLDRRMRGYVAQAGQSLGLDYQTKVYSNLDEIHDLVAKPRDLTSGSSRPPLRSGG